MKRRSLFLLGGVLVSIILLSGSLSNLELQAGSPFPDINSHYTASQPTPQQLQAHSFTSLPAFVGLVLLLAIIYVLMRLTALVKLKQLLRWFLRFILALIALFTLLLILSYLNLGPTGASEWILEIAPSSSKGISTSPLGRPPVGLIWFVAMGFVLIVGWIIARVFKWQGQSPHTEAALLQQAKNAMEALRGGRDLKNVIVDCYLQMMNILREEHGIERNSDMTTREFQDWLELKGWPSIPVQELTSLFERVRYGKQHLSESDEKIAHNSLSEIVRFAERAKDEAPAE